MPYIILHWPQACGQCLNEKQSPEHEVSSVVRILFAWAVESTCGWGLLRVVLTRNYSINEPPRLWQRIFRTLLIEI